MEFKKLEIEQEGSWFKRQISSKHFVKSLIYILLGAFLGFVFTYFSEGRDLALVSKNDLLTNIFTGAFFGFFITNSPCARNKC